ncbi:MAG: hypothetical protein N2578_01440 [Bdellovibrionaceae bacterium]|nr:hypothetical protein [Pseudobdellovibrionaceae bacterium]
MKEQAAKVTFLGIVCLTSGLSMASENRNWGLQLGVTRTANLFDRQDGNFSESLDFQTNLRLTVSKNWNAGLGISYSRDQKRPENSSWSDLSLRLSRKGYEIGRWGKLSPSLISTLPTSVNSSQRQSLIAGLGGAMRLSLQPTILTKGLNLGASLSLIRLIHEYETSTTGAVNTAWSSKQSIDASYETGRFNIGAGLSHRSSWSYQNVLRTSFEHFQELGYSATDNFSLAVGHSFGGPVFKPNGFESNFSLYNEDESMLYATLNLSF